MSFYVVHLDRDLNFIIIYEFYCNVLYPNTSSNHLRFGDVFLKKTEERELMVLKKIFFGH